MEWLLLGVGALALLVLVAGRRGGTPDDRGGTLGTARGPAAATAVAATAAVTAAGPGSGRETVLGRALDPDNPDGAFMDGYLAGRYTERYATTQERDGPGADPPGSARASDSEDDGSDDWSDDWSDDGSPDGWDEAPDESSHEASADAWSGPAWSDPTAQDVAWETGQADDLDDW